MFEWRFRFLLLFFILSGVYFFFPTTPINAVGCGGTCGGSYTCDTGLSCKPTTLKCGKQFDTCTGVNANSKLCSNNNVWDIVTPCDGVSLGDTCTGTGVWRTAIWGAPLGVCSATCGLGTQTRRCNCSANNGCAVSCLTPAGACGAVGAPIACCVDSSPDAPTGVSVIENNPDYAFPTRINVSWDFGAGANGCGNEWGYVCGTRANSFTIEIDGANNTTGISSAARTATITVGSWGSHTVQVCALNGYTTTCSTPATSFTITAPTCTVSGQSPTSGCYSAFPDLSASIGTGADQIQYGVDTSNPLVSPWTCDSGWTTGNYTSCNPLATDTYYWSAHAQSTNSPTKCTTSSLSPVYTLNVDKTAPPIPVPNNALTPDGACLGKYKVVHSWNAVTNTPEATYGCAALDPNPYWSQASLNIGFPTNVFPINTWGTYTSQTTSISYAPGTTIYTHVASRDALGNPSPIVWSGPETIVIPAPSPYPTIHVSGPLSEDINGTCNPMTLVSSFTLAPVIAPVAGITPAVTPICPTLAPGATTYSCNFIIDNQKGDCVSPNIEVTMGGTYSGYGTIGWRSGDLCSGYPISHSYTVGASDANIPLYFSYNTTLPTPLPTVTPGGPTVTPSPTPPPVVGWFKLKDTSFNSQLSGRTNYIPSNIQSYGDGDTISTHDMLIGSAGVLLQDGRLEPGANALDATGNPIYSRDGWYTQGYTYTNDIDYLKYIDYLKGRRNITSIDTLSGVTTGIYTITPSEDITLNSADFDNKKVVLVVEGDKNVVISSNFIPTNGSVALLAKKIVIESSVTEVKAILIGQSITIGDSTSPLKIEGNIIDEGVLTLGRARNDASKPSLFVVSNVRIYLDLLPYLSTSTYDWKQIQ